MTTKIGCLVALVVLIATVAFAQERYVKPFDEAKLDLTFVAFRAKLISAAERKDAAYILKIIDPTIKLSFGGDEGIASFKSMWRINDKDSKFWAEFLPVIKNGGRFVRDNGRRQNLFYAPYSFNGFPDDLDAFEYAMIFGANVNLRKTPSTDGEIIGRLSYNIVKPQYENTDDDPGTEAEPKWIRLVTLGGKSGYVHADYVRSPIDYRAGFEKKRGVWKMVTFIAGD